MSGDNPRRSKEEWDRVLSLKHEMERMTEWHTLADVTAREKSPYLLSNQAEGSNRAERRKHQAQSRKARS